MILRFLPFSLLVFLGFSCGNGDTPDENAAGGSVVRVSNKADVAQNDALISLDIQSLQSTITDFDPSKIKLTEGEAVIPFDLVDKDADGTPDALLLSLDVPAFAERQINIGSLSEGETLPDFPKRTQAELSHKTGGNWENREYQAGSFENVQELHVPEEHTDHSWFIRYEGPGWESDLVGYRFYLDWRNATDIFGKKTTDMVLQGVGQDGFDSYHEPAGWGMDILKVGQSLGMGSPGIWTGEKAMRVEKTDSLYCEVAENGDLRSAIQTTYYGWDAGEAVTKLVSTLSIDAGSRLTRAQLKTDAPLSNLCTGIVKHDSARVIKSDGAADWGYLATWGKQSLAEDMLGMAILYKKSDLISLEEDEHSHIAQLKPSENNTVTYYYLAAWEQDPNAIKTEAEFIQYLNNLTKTLSSPLEVSVSVLTK
ncbi:MAG: DUF4861 domain-containing protein [Bacteroidetes bacterium]|nr:DUF4861 domain-containing protein [Bacteroidota bacterium]